MSFHGKNIRMLRTQIFQLRYLNVIFLGLFQTKGRVKLTKKNEKKCNNYQTVLQTLDILFTIAFFPWISFSV